MLYIDLAFVVAALGWVAETGLVHANHDENIQCHSIVHTFRLTDTFSSFRSIASRLTFINKLFAVHSVLSLFRSFVHSTSQIEHHVVAETINPGAQPRSELERRPRPGVSWDPGSGEAVVARASTRAAQTSGLIVRAWLELPRKREGLEGGKNLEIELSLACRPTKSKSTSQQHHLVGCLPPAHRHGSERTCRTRATLLFRPVAFAAPAKSLEAHWPSSLGVGRTSATPSNSLIFCNE
jgi:hypothetical protein